MARLLLLALSVLAVSTLGVPAPPAGKPNTNANDDIGFWVCADPGVDMFEPGCSLQESIGNATIHFGQEEKTLHVRAGTVLSFDGQGPSFDDVSALPGTTISSLTHEEQSRSLEERAPTCVNNGRLGDKRRKKGGDGRTQRFANCKPAGSLGSDSAMSKGAHNCLGILGGTHYLCCISKQLCVEDGKYNHKKPTKKCHVVTQCTCDPVSKWMSYHGGECFKAPKRIVN